MDHYFDKEAAFFYWHFKQSISNLETRIVETVQNIMVYIPFFLTCCFCVVVIHRLRRSGLKRAMAISRGTVSQSRRSQETRLTKVRSNSEIASMAVTLIIVSFIICLLPAMVTWTYNLAWSCGILPPYLQPSRGDVTEVIFYYVNLVTAVFLITLNSGINPFIYYLKNILAPLPKRLRSTIKRNIPPDMLALDHPLNQQLSIKEQPSITSSENSSENSRNNSSRDLAEVVVENNRNNGLDTPRGSRHSI